MVMIYYMTASTARFKLSLSLLTMIVLLVSLSLVVRAR